MTVINKKTLEHLAELSRIELDAGSEEKLLKDIQDILNYFEQLKEVDTENVFDVSIQDLKNVFREDEGLNQKIQGLNLTEQFMEEENGFLKIPPVFE